MGFWVREGSPIRWLRWARVFKFGSIIELHLSFGEHYRGLHPLNAHVPALRAEDSQWVLSWGDLLRALGDCPGWTQELRYALSCVALW